MKRFLTLLALVCLVCNRVATAEAPLASAQSADRPDVVLFLADDLGYGDIGPFGSTLNRTPNLDRMAREGMRLTSFYGCPVCTPSRAQFMTGCYAKRVSMPDVIFPCCPTGLNPEEPTVAKLLKAQGYATMIVGKWHLGDQRQFLPTHYGFDHYFGLPYSNDMGGGEDADPNPRSRPPLPLVRDETVIEAPAVQDTLTARYTEEALNFISTNRGKPFFLYLAHTAVHVPLHPGRAFRGKSHNGTYGDWVEELDWSAGKVLDKLRETGLASKTLVIFTSDNGPWLVQGKDGGTAGPLRGGKGSTWEGGVREPTIAWWPGHVPAGTECNAITANLDILPTFVQLAGGKTPTDRVIDGMDIGPILTGRSKVSPHDTFFYFNSGSLEAVRSGPWKLRQAPVEGEGPEGAPGRTRQASHLHLYNLDSNIGETIDLSAAHPDVVARLRVELGKMETDLGSVGGRRGIRPPGRVDNPIHLVKR